MSSNCLVFIGIVCLSLCFTDTVSMNKILSQKLGTGNAMDILSAVDFSFT